MFGAHGSNVGSSGRSSSTGSGMTTVLRSNSILNKKKAERALQSSTKKPVDNGAVGTRKQPLPAPPLLHHASSFGSLASAVSLAPVVVHIKDNPNGGGNSIYRYVMALMIMAVLVWFALVPYYFIVVILQNSTLILGGITSKSVVEPRMIEEEHEPETLLGAAAHLRGGSPRRNAPGLQTAPVVAVFSQPLLSSFPVEPDWKEKYPNYIAASYIKWVESGGARAIPIPYDAPPPLVDEILSQVNAVLLPGGSAIFNPTLRYLLDRVLLFNKVPHPSAAVHDALDHFYQLDQETVDDDDHDYFPVWGTCLGFEFLIQYASTTMNHTLGVDVLEWDSEDEAFDTNHAVPQDDYGALQEGFHASNVSYPLYEVVRRELYVDGYVYQVVTTQNVTLNNHHLGITPRQFLTYTPVLNEWWEVTSTNLDERGRPFVSTIEPRNPQQFPWYGVQYHPEKNPFEYATYPHTNIPYEVIDHSPDAVEFAMYQARFFTSLARTNQRHN
jgi:gamma-glutamyl hydrolase